MTRSRKWGSSSTFMFDSISPQGIPATAQVVAGYGDGAYQWSAAGWDRFPGAVKLSIVVHPEDQGDILDVENGNATPADCPGWCDRFSRPGRRAPTIYCNRGTWPAVRAALGGRHVDYWIATLDGTAQVPGAVAVQYVDVGAFDLSVIQDPSWIQHPPQEDLRMLLLTNPVGEVWLLSGSLYVYVDQPLTLQNLVQAGLKQATIDGAMHQELQKASARPALTGQLPLSLSGSGSLSVG